MLFCFLPVVKIKRALWVSNTWVTRHSYVYAVKEIIIINQIHDSVTYKIIKKGGTVFKEGFLNLLYHVVVNSISITLIIFVLSGLLFSGSSGILSTSYASQNNILKNNFFWNLEEYTKKVDNSQLMESGHYLMNDLREGKIVAE